MTSNYPSYNHHGGEQHIMSNELLPSNDTSSFNQLTYGTGAVMYGQQAVVYPGPGVASFGTDATNRGVGMTANNHIHQHINAGFNGTAYGMAQQPPTGQDTNLEAILNRINELQRAQVASFEVAAALRSDNASLREEVAALSAKVEGRLQDDEEVQPRRRQARVSTRSEPRVRNTAVERLVRQKALSTLGISNCNSRVPRVLPSPLAPGEVAQRDEANEEYSYPIWDAGIKHPTNEAWVVRVVRGLMADEGSQPVNEQVFAKLSDRDQIDAVKTYFYSLSRRWKEITDPEAAKKAESQNRGSMCYQRQHRLADKLRAIAPIVEADLSHHFKRPVERYGDIIHSDWLDDFADDSGNATLEAWNAAKAKQGYGEKVKCWEARKRGWVSPSLRRLIQFGQKKIREADKKKSTLVVHTPVFKGLLVNQIEEGPTGTKPFASCVDPAWKARTGNEALEFPQHDPQVLGVLDLELPDSLFDAEDLEWMADDEQEVGEDI